MSFEEGHQPWRGDPLWVAAGAIGTALKDELGVEDLPYQLIERLKVECETDSEAIVVGTGNRFWYKVYLKRLVPSTRGRLGIWTAVRLEYASPTN